MGGKTKLNRWLFISILSLALVGISPARQIFVDPNAPGKNDGSSWNNAFNSLQDALAIASSGDQILVAKGTYKPDQGKAITSGDRGATFKLINGVVIRGGYAGYGEPKPNVRDIETYKSILSGDLNGDDEPNFVNNSDNSYNVVTSFGTDKSAVLDGFIITGGNANTNGGGMHNYRASPMLNNCTFKANSALFGAGMYNDQSKPTLFNCTFAGNRAGDAGGGIYNATSSPTLNNCTFSENSALNGGGMYCNYESNPTLTNCTFTGNSARNSGGMANYLNSNSKLNNCRFIANSADYGGGMRNYNSNPILNSCTFSNNSASGGGGAINNNSSNPTLNSCMFIENSTQGHGGAMRNYKSSPMLNGCTLTRNTARQRGGGISNRQDCNLTLTNCILWQNNDAGGEDEAAQIYLTSSTLAANYCCIQAWTGSLGGTGNINEDPMFAHPESGDYHLQPTSPCINTGDVNYVATAEVSDIDGEPRVIKGRIDIGADEYNNQRLVPTVYLTVQAAIDSAFDGDVIIINPGGYSGPGNRDIDFKGKAITVRGINPSDVDVIAATIINCENEGRGFYFHSGEDANSVINGLTIINGNATNGGGIYCENSNPKIINCTIANNSAKHSGGGMYNDRSNPALSNCSFTGNLAYYGGGGMLNYNSSPSILNCTFRGNWARYGGGMHNRDGSSPTLRNCLFTDNSTTTRGGGMDNYDSRPTLTNCIFNNNSANTNGGGMFNQRGEIILTNCRFNKNEAHDNGGGVYHLDGRATLTNCRFNANNSTDHGGGVFNANSSPTLTNCTFIANIAKSNGGGIYHREGEPNLKSCTFSGNSAANYGGAIFNNDSPKLINCTFSSNTAKISGGMYNDNSNFNCKPVLSNCIFWNNKDSTDDVMWAQIYGDTPVVTYSCIQDADPNDQNVYLGMGNIDKDPRFVKLGYWTDPNNPNAQVGPGDPNVIWIEADHHLLPDSPCIDAGDPKSDFSKEPQPNGGRINMGAYGNTSEAASKGKPAIQSENPNQKAHLGRILLELVYTATLVGCRTIVPNIYLHL